MTKTLTPEVEQAIFAIKSALEDRATGEGVMAQVSKMNFKEHMALLVVYYLTALEAKEKPDA